MRAADASPERGGRSQDPPDAAVAQTQRVADDVVDNAWRDGERIVSWGRLFIGLVILLAWPVATWEGLVAGERANWAVLGLALTAVNVSVGVLALLRRARVPTRVRLGSIVVDAVLSLALLAVFVVWPADGYLGFGRISGIGTAYFAILAAGLRLSRRGIALSVGIMVPGILALMAVDELRNGISDTLPNRITILACTVTSGVLAWLISNRTRELVQEGASQALIAERARTRLATEVRALSRHLQAQVRDRSATISTALESLVRSEDLSKPAPGTIIDNRFELVRRLGAGGMGEVYEGRDLDTGVAVAIKVIRATSGQEVEALQRFVREARAAATIDHPAVVRMLGVDISDDGLLFQVQERIPGVTLEARLRASLMEPGTAARVGSVLCSALSSIHGAGIIHRDIKPGNIMLTAEPPGVKIIDFGVAKLTAAEDEQTGTGRYIGTPAYMAPEQRSVDGEVTDRLDIFACGLVLFRMITGELPRSSDVAGELRAEGAPQEYVDVVETCLAANAASRPDAAALEQRLRGIADAAGAPDELRWDDLHVEGEVSQLMRDLVRADAGHTTVDD